MSKVKKVLGVYGPGSNHWVGDGFPVRNMFPSNGLKDEINPFLMLDYAGPSYFEPSKQSHGVGEHPHRGFETVTIAYQGAVAHRDSAGNSGVICPGDVQWMTAASGVVHEEMHEREFAKNGGTFEMIQLWVNLPKAIKMSKPRYQGITKEQIPAVDLGSGSYTRVIAGELHGVRGPASTFTPLNLFDTWLTRGSKVELQIPEGHNAGVLVLKGDVVLNGENSIKGEAHIATLSQDGESIALEAKEDTTLLLLSGEPINEPVFSYGPFVMNTRDEIMQAVRDYNDGKMGHLQ
ncbi:MAG: pirin family protein [Alloacidobacterium sp.]